MKRIFAHLLLLTSTLPVFAQTTSEPVKPNNSVQNYAEKIMGYSMLKHSAFSFYVKDMTTGDIVADYNGEMSLTSASTMKLVTTATATQLLGRGYNFETEIMYSGTIDSTGTLHGDLYIIGGGDPTLGSKYYTEEGHERDFLYNWADSLYNYGIRCVKGRVIADGSLYKYQGVPSGWVWGDMGNYYGAGPAGLTIFDNMCQLHFKTGPNDGDSTVLHCITPHIPDIRILNYVTAANSSKDNAYVYGAPYSNDWFVMGEIPKGEEDFEVKASIPDPEYIAALEFDYALEQRGIDVYYAPVTMRQLSENIPFKKPDLKRILVHYSPSLASIMDITNKHSINLFAEHILCQISVKKSGYGSTHNGALICENYWQTKIGNGLFMTDGSGLSRSNAVSAKFLVDMLTYMNKTSSASGFKSSMAVAGKSGTMSSLCRGTDAAGRVYGKSGTMTRVKSYAGYVDTKTGKKLAYAMIINNHMCSNSKVTDYFEMLMVHMAQY